MNRLRQTRNLISKMKRNFGSGVVFRRYTINEQNVTTGKIDKVSVDTNIRRAIVLPIREIRKFIYDISYLAANKNFTYGGFFDVNDRVIIIDKKDLLLTPTLNDHVIVDGLLYKLKTFTTTEGYAGYVLVVETISSEEVT